MGGGKVYMWTNKISGALSIYDQEKSIVAILKVTKITFIKTRTNNTIAILNYKFNTVNA